MSSSAAANADAPLLERSAALLRGLRDALTADAPEFAAAPLHLMQDKGLAHDHVQLVGAGLLARVPKQSQMRLDARANLRYEQACFERAAASERVPFLQAVLPVSAHLPHGALLVEEVPGTPVRLPQNLPALAQALASVHALGVPAHEHCAPLLYAADPLIDLLLEVQSQAAYLEHAGLAKDAVQRIQAELSAFEALCLTESRPARCLIAFDAHPGNFLQRDDGAAILVDLEKCRYSYASLDVAHATLYTSTTWDVNSHAYLTHGEVVQAYAHWERCMGVARADEARKWHAPLRRAMWLWSITWCAQWRVLSRQHAHADAQGQDWSADLSSQALVAHVAERVAHYLSAPVVLAVCDGLDRFARDMRT